MRLPRRISRTAAVSAAVAGAAVIVAVVVALIVWPDDDAPTNPSAPGVTSTASPSPAPTGPLSKAPRTIPAVRDFDAARGPGWRPSPSGRVIADPRGPLGESARVLARDLDLKTASGPARRGDVELRLGHDGGPESYTMATRDGRVVITGADEAGAFYGTRTVVQAVRSGGQVPEGTVRDRPDRPQRGLNLDIARKFFDADWIEARLREMADLKLNQLCLHFSDDQGFRVESESHPEIVSDQHLTKDQLRHITDLATSLHIEVIPEIDSPGHLGAVFKAHPGLQLRKASGAPAPGAADISDKKAAQIVDDLLREYAPLFPGPYTHLGGDEYLALMARDPEGSYPGLAEAARAEYGPDAKVQDLATGWLNDRAKTVRSLGGKAKVWNDGVHAGGVVTADKNREVEYWTGTETGAREPLEYLKEGRKLVNLNDEFLYYVLGQPNQFRYPTGQRIYERWTPAVLRGTKPVPAAMAGPDRVLGGRLAIWGDIPGAQTTEQVARGIRLPLRALSQKLWDPRRPELSWKEFTALADRVEH
ncbi:beta-N-acetylhexosaminidase [Streptomyces varsoviensis]|uniref:Beta-N-acetylglucosaminidase n=1 Tax=Streptomyces varsoviensis TaxID=67373 RepID=A0ABR5J100_9ACTN|nr:glycoside hydrolase family 20 protein [Streptomyces varsoviensis]KOG87098.1 beta-N-acetylglucosaminidase [Streptomyces varsoviensis]